MTKDYRLLLRQGINQHIVALFITEYGIATGSDSDILYAVNFIADGRCIDPGICLGLPQQFAAGSLIGIEVAITLASEQQATRRRLHTSNQWLLGFLLPAYFPVA